MIFKTFVTDLFIIFLAILQISNSERIKRHAIEPVSSAGRFKYLVVIRNYQNPDFTSYCNGVLISSKSVLTTADCATLSGKDLWVTYGSNNMMKKRSHLQHNSVKSVRIHPNYTGNFQKKQNAQYNIAVLSLSGFSGASSINLPKENIAVNKAVLASWGLHTSSHNEEAITMANRKIRTETMIVLNRTVCEETYEMMPLTDTCAKSTENSSHICLEDIGAPLIMRHVYTKQDILLGLLYYAPNNCFDENHDVYQFIRIHLVMDWIKSVM